MAGNSTLFGVCERKIKRIKKIRIILSLVIGYRV